MSKLRENILKAGRGMRSEVVDFVGHKVEVRALSVRAQHTIYKQASVTKRGSDDTEIDGALMQVCMCLAASFHPDTGELVFDPADRDTFLDDFDPAAINALFVTINELNGSTVDTKEGARELRADPTGG
jgi:nitrite reductase/ring-hydroxylating ferredoxin subunit